MPLPPGIVIARLPPGFGRWPEMLALIHAAFAPMDGVIDPPSSARALTAGSLREKAEREACFIAMAGGALLGCVFAAERPDCIYVGKLAVAPAWQRRGLGAALVAAAEAHARRLGKPALELQTRVELTGNHAAFARLGFVETARTAHAGYDRATSITMRKPL